MFTYVTYILPSLVLIPFLSSIVLLFCPGHNIHFIRKFGLFSSILVFLASLLLFLLFDRSSSRFQFVFDLVWIPSSNLNLSLGIDGISILFVLLSTLLMPLCLLASWDSITKHYK